MGIAEKFIPESFEKYAEYVFVSNLISIMTYYITGL